MSIKVDDYPSIIDFIDRLDRNNDRYIIQNIAKLLIEDRNPVPYTANSSGIFVKVSDLDTFHLEKLVNYINFTINNINLDKERQRQKAKLIQECEGIRDSAVIDEESVTVSEKDRERKKVVLKNRKKTYTNKWSKILKDCKNTKSVKDKRVITAENNLAKQPSITDDDDADEEPDIDTNDESSSDNDEVDEFDED